MIDAGQIICGIVLMAVSFVLFLDSIMNLGRDELVNTSLEMLLMIVGLVLVVLGLGGI